MTDEERLAEIRADYNAGYEKAYAHIPWLLEKLAEREARIAKLEAELEALLKLVPRIREVSREELIKMYPNRNDE